MNIVDKDHIQPSESSNNDNEMTSENICKSETKLLDDLELLLTKEWQEAGLSVLPDNYFSIESIVKLPKFSIYTVVEITTAVFSDKKLRFSVRGLKIRLKPPELNKDPDVILSKRLAWILRHAGEKEGMAYSEGGYLHADDLLRIPEFGDYSFSDICRVINNNDKKRFEIRKDPLDSRIQVRAFQGHTAKVDVGQRLITDPNEFPIVLHGTYLANLEKILEIGLKRMGRTHIHLTSQKPEETSSVISGMRSSAEVIIYVDISSAIGDGIKFFISNNQVILCEGDEQGTLLPKYFSKIEHRECEMKDEHINDVDTITLL